MGRMRFQIVALCCAALAFAVVATPRTHPYLRRIAYALHVLHPIPALKPGSAFPSLLLSQLDGAPVTLKPAARGTQIYNVFTTWCPSCRIEAPLFARAARAGATIVGIDQGESAESIERFQQYYGIRYRILIDRDSITNAWLSARVIPETIVVRDGTVQEIAVGPVTPEFLAGATGGQ
jgi:thiol-disulfide isomerase/thioredoxin